MNQTNPPLDPALLPAYMANKIPYKHPRRIYTQSYSAMTRSTDPEIIAAVSSIRNHPACGYTTYQLLFDKIYSDIRDDLAGCKIGHRRWANPVFVKTVRLQSASYLCLLLDDIQSLLEKVNS